MPPGAHRNGGGIASPLNPGRPLITTLVSGHEQGWLRDPQSRMRFQERWCVCVTNVLQSVVASQAGHKLWLRGAARGLGLIKAALASRARSWGTLCR